ncbi:MAG: CoA transferase [Alphaproteobacteria bacterium]|nr:CoA transferase [Alphaproteobacteria bacterium]
MTGKTKASQGPLHGIRIIDLTQFVLGPYATQTLGDLGADVIKVEEPSGDRQRNQGKAPKSQNMGPLYVALNRNKRSVAIDLKSDEGKAALRTLIATGDVFIHNMRPEAVKRLGFGYDDVAAIKADIVYVEAVGYGSGGPYSGRQAFDDLIQGASGACDLLRLYDGNEELRPFPSIIADKTCGLFAVIATLAALQHRARTGEGQFVEVPMLETFTGFIQAEHIWGKTYPDVPGKFGHPTTITPHRKPYKTKDGYLVVLPASREGSVKFLELGGIPDAYNSERFLSAADGKARVEAYYQMMRDAAATRTTEEWMQLCAEHHVPAMRANEMTTLFEDPHFKAVDFFEEREIKSEGRYRTMRPGLKFAKTPCSIRLEPPTVGEHTDEILTELKAQT